MFEYFVDPKARQWALWESKLSSAYKPPPDTPFFKILVSLLQEADCRRFPACTSYWDAFIHIESPL